MFVLYIHGSTENYLRLTFATIEKEPVKSAEIQAAVGRCISSIKIKWYVVDLALIASNDVDIIEFRINFDIIKNIDG